MKLIILVLIFLIFFNYFGYFLLLKFINLFIREKEYSLSEENYPKVTIIFSAFNEENVITEKLENFLELDYPKDKIDLVIGSDGSKDKTSEIINNFAKNEKRVQFFDFKENEGKISVLNKIVKKAKGEILVFTDANTIYKKDAILKLVKPFSSPEIGCVSGRLIYVNKDEGNLAEKGEISYWNYESLLKELEGNLGFQVAVNGAIYSIRKHLFRALPKERLISDDTIIPITVQLQGFKAIYLRDAVGYENASPSFNTEYKRKIRISILNSNTFKYIKPILLKFKLCFGYISHKLLRWLTPVFLLLIFGINLFVTEDFIFSSLLKAQTIFYSFSIIGFLLQKSGKSIKIFTFPCYFVWMNFAILVGFFKSFNKKDKPVW